MFLKGGLRPFFVGSSATLGRDLVFGGTYALLRHELLLRAFPHHHQSSTQYITGLHGQKKSDSKRFLINMFSACMATILSSPMNYVRNVHYATPPDTKPLNTLAIFKDLIAQTKIQPTMFLKFQYVITKLRIGWGTARVGVGMAFGSEFYYFCSQAIK
jgi:hypothetical protein